jgi:hypothetical protein
MPSVTGSRPQSASVPGEDWPKLETPPPSRLIGDIETALGEEFLDVSVAQGEAKIQPNSVPNDLWWELVASVGDGLHGLP